LRGTARGFQGVGGAGYRVAALAPASGVVALPAEAGWAALLRVRSPKLDDEGFALRLLEDAGVLVQPGSLFELAPEPGVAHLVLSLLPEPGRFEGGVAALAGLAETLA
jgi:aspartate/methionine/tyrosine aminotransferase